MNKREDIYMIDESYYYVYEHWLDDNIIYVGKGKNMRAYSLERNKYWKTIVKDRICDVKVIIKGYFKREEDALIFESLLIMKYVKNGEKLSNIMMNNKINESFNGMSEEVEKYIKSEENKRMMKKIEKIIQHNVDYRPIDVRIMEKEKSLGIIKSYLGEHLTSKEKDIISEALDIRRNENNRLVKWTTIKKTLLNNGYEIQDKRKRINGKQISYSIITKKQD